LALRNIRHRAYSDANTYADCDADTHAYSDTDAGFGVSE
jgi:hypothetical protein